MRTVSLLAQAIRAITMAICASVMLVGCTIVGGETRTMTPERPVALTPLPTNPAVAQALAQRQDTWVIGLQDAPESLYPYQPEGSSQRAAVPLLELLFPSPILTYGYEYTTTGVLERIPSLENGDARFQKAQVYLDVAGNITTTVTDVVTEVDQLVIDYHWNERLYWSDGQPVTAADSVFAYELAKQSPPNNEARDKLSQLASYEVVDEHTTRATLKPDVIGPTYFLSYWTPLPQHILKDTSPDAISTSDFARNPIGYGPYAIKEWAQDTIRMERNKHYFGPAPAVSQLVATFVADVVKMRANIANGDLDVAVAERIPIDQFSFLEQDKRSGLSRVDYLPGPGWEHIDFNLDVSTLQDIRVRRAIAHGTNRQAMVDELFQGHVQVLDSWILPQQFGSAPADQITRYPYNPDEARSLLDQTGYLDTDGDGIRSSADGVTLTLQLLLAENNPIREEIARRFQQDMRAIGIQIEITKLPPEEFSSPDGPLFQRQFELVLFGWLAAADPGGFSRWSCAEVPSEQNAWTGQNFAGWCFRDADRAIREAVTLVDPQKRYAAYLRQQQLWAQELPVLPLFQRPIALIANPKVQGPTLDALAPITWNVALWRRDQ